MTKNTILGVFLAGVMLCGSIPLGFSEPVLQQWKNTNDINEVQCDNSNHVLVMRSNGNPACVYESTAQKLGWEMLEVVTSLVEIKMTANNEEQILQNNNDSSNNETESLENESVNQLSSLYDDTSKVLIKSEQPYDPKDFPLNQYSDKLATQRAPSSMQLDNPSYPDKLVRFDSDGNIYQHETALNNDFPIPQYSPGSSGDATPQARTFIIDQWIPTEIPDGQELKVVLWTGQLEVRGNVYEGLSLLYAPVDEFFTVQNNTGSVHDINGISLGGEYWVDPKTQEDIDFFEDRLLESSPYYKKTTILGKRALTAEGGDFVPRVLINTEDYRFGLGSYRYNVAELTEVLESIPELQP